MALLVASMSGVGGVVMVVGSNLFRGKIITALGPGTNYINISHESKTEKSSEAVIWHGCI